MLGRKVSKKRRGVALETRALLVEKFPACFKPKGQPKLPLKVGIRHDLNAALEGVVAKWRITAALTDYTSGPTYWRACTAGAPRYDLSGLPAGSVTADEAKEFEALVARLPGTKVAA